MKDQIDEGKQIYMSMEKVNDMITSILTPVVKKATTDRDIMQDLRHEVEEVKNINKELNQEMRILKNGMITLNKDSRYIFKLDDNQSRMAG